MAVEGANDGSDGGGRANKDRNSFSDRSRPSSVRTSDFDLFTGSLIMPFL